MIITFPDCVSAHKFLAEGFTNDLRVCDFRPTRQSNKQTDFFIYGVPIEISTSEIKEAVEEIIGEEVRNTFRLSRRANGNNKFLTRTIKITTSVRHAHLFENGITLFGVNKYKTGKLQQQMHINQCTRCTSWAPGHTHKQCGAEEVICKICSGEHDYRECNKNNPEYYKCVNGGGSHKSTYTKCPRLLRIRETSTPYQKY